MDYEGSEGLDPQAILFNHSAFIIFKRLKKYNYLKIPSIWGIRASGA
jgi:hypothetical protein